MEDSISRRALLGALTAGTLLPGLAPAQTFPADRVPVLSRELWPWMRAQLLLGQDVAWFDTARFGPTLRAIVAREFRSLERQSRDFPGYYAATFGSEALGSPLAGVAGFLGADPAEIVLTSGAGAGLGLVAQGLDLQGGDEVLTTTHDHDAAVYPWLVQARRRGIKVVQLPQSGAPVAPDAIVAQFAAALTPQTRVVAFAHVRHTDGTVMPAKEICALARAHGAFSVVDGAQAPGLVDVAVRDLGCDAYATCFHKWVNGPAGSGALYLRRESQARLWPASVEGAAGWSDADRYGDPVAAEASSAQARFGAQARYLGPQLDALPIAFEFQQTVNRGRAAMRVRELAAYLRLQVQRLPGVEIVSPTHPSLASGIVSLRIAGRDHGVMAQSMAAEDGIVVGRVRHGAAFDVLRVSLHPSIETREIDRLATAIQRRL